MAIAKTSTTSLTRGGTIKASSAASGGAAGSNSAYSGSTGISGGRTSGAQGRGASGSGAASTPSLGQSLLDDTIFAPADSSSSGLKSVSSQRHGKQLVILQDSLVQSSVALLRELIARATQRNHAVLLVSVLRRPETYLDGTAAAARGVTSVDATMLANAYAGEDDGAIKSTAELAERIKAGLTSLNANATKTIVVIDSLNAISRAAGDAGLGSVSRVVRETLSAIGSSSRLVVGVQMGGVETSVSAGLLTALHSPLIWGPTSSITGSSSTTSGGTILSATLHPPALFRHIIKQYGLKPPSSSAAVRRALAFSGSHDVEDEAEEVDVRFWDVLRNVASRGPLGVPSYEAGGGAQGGGVANLRLLKD